MSKQSARLALSWMIRILFSFFHRLIYWKRYQRVYSVNVALITYPRYLSLSRIFLNEFFLHMGRVFDESNTKWVLIFHPYSARSKTSWHHNGIFIEYLVLSPNILLSLVTQFFKDQILSNSKIKKSFFDIVVEHTWNAFFAKSPLKNLIGMGLQGQFAKIAHFNDRLVFEIEHGIPPAGFSATFNHFTFDERADCYLVWHEHYMRHYNLENQPRGILLGYPNRETNSKKTKNRISVLIGLTVDHPPLWDPWGLLTHEIKFAIERCLELGYLVQLRLHPFSTQDISIGPKSKPTFKSINSFFREIFPNISSISHPHYVSVYEEIDNSDLVIAQGTLAFNAVARGTPAVIFSQQENSPDLPPEFLKSGSVFLTSFDDFGLNCKKALGKKINVQLKGLTSEFVLHLKP